MDLREWQCTVCGYFAAGQSHHGFEAHLGSCHPDLLADATSGRGPAINVFARFSCQKCRKRYGSEVPTVFTDKLQDWIGHFSPDLLACRGQGGPGGARSSSSSSSSRIEYQQQRGG